MSREGLACLEALFCRPTFCFSASTAMCLTGSFMPTLERRNALLQLLQEIARQQREGEINDEQAHRDADAALLAYIRDSAVLNAFERIERWYA